MSLWRALVVQRPLEEHLQWQSATGAWWRFYLQHFCLPYRNKRSGQLSHHTNISQDTETEEDRWYGCIWDPHVLFRHLNIVLPIFPIFALITYYPARCKDENLPEIAPVWKVQRFHAGKRDQNTKYHQHFMTSNCYVYAWSKQIFMCDACFFV